MTTIMNPDDNALLHIAIINPTGAVAHDKLARFSLRFLVDVLNEAVSHRTQRFFATEEERDAFIAEHNARGEEE